MLISNRIHYSTAFQLITGHTGLNKHLYSMNITGTIKCPLVTTRQRQWLISLDIAQLTHKFGPASSKHFTPIQTTYVTNAGHNGIVRILSLRKRNPWIILDSEMELISYISTPTPHELLLSKSNDWVSGTFIFSPNLQKWAKLFELSPLWDMWPTPWVLCLSFSNHLLKQMFFVCSCYLLRYWAHNHS